MQRADKERVVAELAERLKGAETLIVADYRGLTVSEIGELRGKLLEHGARFSVVKNSLTKRAAESAGIEPLLAWLEGPTAIAFLETGGDPVAVAKALEEPEEAPAEEQVAEAEQPEPEAQAEEESQEEQPAEETQEGEEQE